MPHCSRSKLHFKLEPVVRSSSLIVYTVAHAMAGLCVLRVVVLCNKYVSVIE